MWTVFSPSEDGDNTKSRKLLLGMRHGTTRENSVTVSYKVKQASAIGLSNDTPGQLAKKTEKSPSTQRVVCNVLSCFIFFKESQIENNPNVHQQVKDKQVLSWYNGILFSMLK